MIVNDGSSNSLFVFVQTVAEELHNRISIVLNVECFELPDTKERAATDIDGARNCT